MARPSAPRGARARVPVRASGRPGRLPALGLALTLALGAAAAAEPAPAPSAAAAAGPVLRVCLDAEDPPFAAAATPDRGIDLDVARALAERLGRPLQPVWVTVPQRGGLEKALRQHLRAGACQLHLGLPQGGDMAQQLAALDLQASPPYLGLGYLLVAPPGRPRPDAAALRTARKIGVVSATPADLHLHRLGLPRAPHGDAAALQAALRAGDIDLALLWSPALAEPGARDLPHAAAPPDGDPELRTARVAALRRDDPALAQAVGAALQALRTEGRIDALAARHGLPPIALP